MTLGQPTRHLATVDSTNTEAMRWLDEDPPAPEGAVVLSDLQTAGKGRWGRSWSSPPGGSLYCSVILRPNMDVARAGLLSLAAGVACVRALRRSSGLDVSLKWPNDVLVGGRKLAGILAESRVAGGTVEAAVIGMGVNLDLPFEDLPAEVAERATSLARETGAAPPAPTEVLAAITKELEPLYRLVLAGGAEVVEAASELCETLGKAVVIRFPDRRSHQGTATRIAPDGRLEVAVGDETHLVDVGEVEQLRVEMKHPPGWKPTPEEVAGAYGKEIPDVIAPGLRVLFCGINPSLYSGATGDHFARPGNRFWTSLHASGFTARLLHPSEKAELLASGLGVTNLVMRATARADELNDDELRAGAERLVAKANKFAPAYIAFLGLTTYRIATGRKKAVIGLQEERIGPSQVWLLPNPSGLNAHYQLPDLARVFGELREAAES